MSERQLNPVLLITITAFVLLFAVAFPQSAYAQGIIYGDTVPAGEIVARDIILAGEDVTIAGDVDGDVFAVGRDITIVGDVSGSLVSLGGNIRIDGAVGGSVYALALSFDMGSESLIGRTLHFIGLSVTMDQGSRIERDLVALSLGAHLAGEVNQDLKAVIGPLELFQFFTGIVGGEIDLLNPGSVMHLPDHTPVRGVDESQVYSPRAGTLASSFLIVDRLVGGEKSTSSDANEASVGAFAQSGIDWEVVLEWFSMRVREFVPLLIIGLLMLWLWPSVIKQGSEKLVAQPLPTLGYGLVGLVLALNAMALVILLALLVFIVGLWLGVVSLWDFAFLFWGIGFTSIILAGSLFAAYVLFATKVVIAYLIGISVLRPLWEDADRYAVVALLLGLLIYVLIAGIPILGFAIRIIVTGLGLGVTWIYLLDRRKKTSGRSTRSKT